MHARDPQIEALLDQRAQLLGSASNWAMWLGRPLPPIFRRARLPAASCVGDLAVLQAAADQQPRGELQQPRRQAHALGRIGDRGRLTRAARFNAPVAIEIGRRALDQRHAVGEQAIELGDPTRRSPNETVSEALTEFNWDMTDDFQLRHIGNQPLLTETASFGPSTGNRDSHVHSQRTVNNSPQNRKKSRRKQGQKKRAAC